MPAIITGALLILATVAVGFIRVSEATWQSWHVAVPALLGLGIGAGIALVAGGLITRN